MTNEGNVVLKETVFAGSGKHSIAKDNCSVLKA